MVYGGRTPADVERGINKHENLPTRRVTGRGKKNENKNKKERKETKRISRRVGVQNPKEDPCMRRRTACKRNTGESGPGNGQVIGALNREMEKPRQDKKRSDARWIT
jgi:hypothetical protein